MIYFWIGMIIAIIIELLVRVGRSGEEEPAEVEEPTFSISNGTIVKTLLGVGLIEWLFRRKK